MARKKSAAKRAREAATVGQAPSGANDIPITKDRPEIAARAPVVSDSEGAYSNSESDEEEDDFGELITEDVEAGINNVLCSIKISSSLTPLRLLLMTRRRRTSQST